MLLLDKPTGITSNRALAQARRAYHAEKAGHTGTLDPLASGLLPICFGDATRFARFLLDAPKRYVASVHFGVTTTTLDREGDVVSRRAVVFAPDDVGRALRQMTGPQLQTPPLHAALKFEGRPYYDYAREGSDVPRAPREIVVHALRLLDWRPPVASIDVECSKGTYVRVLAADLGDALGCGAHLSALRRTATGGFRIADAVTLEALEAMSDTERNERLLPASVLVAQLPPLCLDPDAARRFLHGAAVIADGAADGAAAVFCDGALLGVADIAGGIAQPRRVVPEGSLSTRRSEERA